VILDEGDSDSEAYAAANWRILDEAQSLGTSAHADVVAMLVWDGDSRGEGDVTHAFGQEARRRGLRVLQISTRSKPS